MTTLPTHYEILNLPPSLHQESAIPAQTFRNAYRRALLQNHPDKSSSSLNPSSKPKYTVDQIAAAFAVLGNPKARARYDAELKLQNGAVDGVKGNGVQGFKTGVETVDLDDLEVGEEADGKGVWYRSCRCGQDRGYEVREEDLEEVAGEGEVCVGCKGCSLWLRVLFGVVEEGEGSAVDGMG